MPDPHPAARQILRSRRVVLPEGVRAASIEIRDGRVGSIRPYDTPGAEELADWVIMPGLVDTHVHINEPGRTDWEGFATATRAAAAGGVTTLIEMPLNSIPATISAEALEAKVSAAEPQCFVNVGFWGGVVPGNTDSIQPLREAGCFGYKCFLAPSGVDEFPHVVESDLREAMPKIAALDGILLAHAEDPAWLVGRNGASSRPSFARQYRNYLDSRPRRSEDAAIALLIRLSRETRCRVHIVHLSSSDSLVQIAKARAEGIPITVETCPHYLCLAAEEIPDGATEFKCAPPIRESTNRDALWQALSNGAIDLIASDHSPCPPALKRKDTGDFFSAWGGIASLELGLAAVWTEARRRGVEIDKVARWMCSGPARLAGLGHRKGAIAPGLDADLVIWEPEASFVVEASHLRQRHKLTPYLGRRLFGVVHRTLLRGRAVEPNGPPQGRVIRREQHGH